VAPLSNEREVPPSREREARRFGANAKMITRTRKRGNAISKVAATRDRTRIGRSPEPYVRGCRPRLDDRT
jgi:hypothetical protein